MSKYLNPNVGFYSLAPILLLFLILFAYAAQYFRIELRQKTTIIDYLQGMIDSGTHICYRCTEPRIHANHPEFSPHGPNAYMSTSYALTEQQQEAYSLPPTTDPHDYFDARLIPYKFEDFNLEEVL